MSEEEEEKEKKKKKKRCVVVSGKVCNVSAPLACHTSVNQTRDVEGDQTQRQIESWHRTPFPYTTSGRGVTRFTAADLSQFSFRFAVKFLFVVPVASCWLDLLCRPIPD